MKLLHDKRSVIGEGPVWCEAEKLLYRFEEIRIKLSSLKPRSDSRFIIEPFVLRRTKKEVLKELPDKTTIVLNNEMQEEQEKI